MLLIYITNDSNLELSLLTALIIMIQQHKDYSHSDQPSSLLLFNNTIYQGKYCPTRKIPNGNGLIYFPKQKQVIICSCFKDGELSSQALVYHSKQKYLYGRWKSNKLNGVAVLRSGETVLVAYFQSGNISNQRKAVLFVNQFQLGLLIRLKNGEWQTLQRTEIYCKQHIVQLFGKCEFGDQSIPLSLISFLNEEIAITSNQLARLRFANNKYEYGFEGGLNLIFSQGQQLIGIKFNSQKIMNNERARGEDQDKRLNTLVRKSIERQRTAQAGTIYKQKQHINQYIFHKDLEDPSLQYFAYLQTTFNEVLLKKLRAGLFRVNKTKHIQQSHLQFYPTDPGIQPTNQAVQTSLQESSIEVIDQLHQSEEYSWQRSRTVREGTINVRDGTINARDGTITARDGTITARDGNITARDGGIELPSFQMLPQESRLNIIKQEQKEILHSKILRQKHNSNHLQRNQIEESQYFIQKVEQYKSKQQFQDKQSQTNLVLLSSPQANKQQSSPVSQKRRRAKIFNAQSPLMTRSPNKNNKNTDVKTTYIESELKTDRKLQVEIKVDEVQLSRSREKQAILVQQLESRIAEEIEYDSNDTISVKQINCSPTKFKNRQFSLDNIQIVSTPNRDKQFSQTVLIKQPKEQHLSAEPHFIAIPKPQNKTSNNNRRYDTQGLSDKKLLFDYIMI